MDRHPPARPPLAAPLRLYSASPPTRLLNLFCSVLTLFYPVLLLTPLLYFTN